MESLSSLANASPGNRFLRGRMGGGRAGSREGVGGEQGGGSEGSRVGVGRGAGSREGGDENISDL